MNNHAALNQAIEIAKETAHSGNTANPGWVIEQAYEKILAITKRDNLV